MSKIQTREIEDFSLVLDLHSNELSEIEGISVFTQDFESCWTKVRKMKFL